MLGTNVTTYPTAGAQLSLEMENRNAIRATVISGAAHHSADGCMSAFVDETNGRPHQTPSQIGKSKIANEIDKYTRLTQLAVRFLLQCSFKLVEQCSTCLKASQQMKPLSFFKTPSSGI